MSVGAERLSSVEQGLDKNIGRRAFLGMMAAGIATLFVGKDLFSWLSGGGGGSGENHGFRINSVVRAPEFDEGSWRLSVDGLVRNPLSLTFSEFKDLAQTELVRDFYCVEGWGVEQVRWKGVRMSDIMDLTQIQPEVTHFIFYSSDGVYTDSVTVEEALRPDTMLVYMLNGELLPKDLGRPVRLILPGNYGYKYVKWVFRVEAAALGVEGYKGYWEERGYPADATIS